MHMCFNGKKKKMKKKCLLQTEYCMTVIKQVTGEVDVTAPTSSRILPVSLEYQRLSGRPFPCKIIVESQKNRISCSCKVCILAECEIDWLNTTPKKCKQHGHESNYECAQCIMTLCIDPCFRFYHQQKDYITKYKSWKRQNNNWLCKNIHAWHKISVSYNFINIYIDIYL